MYALETECWSNESFYSTLELQGRIPRRKKGSAISGGVVMSYDMLTKSVHRLKAEEPEIYVWVALIKVILKENQDTDKLFPI